MLDTLMSEKALLDSFWAVAVNLVVVGGVSASDAVPYSAAVLMLGG